MMNVLVWLRRVEALFAGLLLCGIVAVVFFGSAGRYFGRPVIWSDEVAQALFVWTTMLAADLTLQRNGHFRIDMLTSMLPLRARKVLELATKLVLLALLCLLAWSGLQLARMTAARPLPMTGVSSAVAIAALPVGFVLMMITMFEQFVQQWRTGGVEQAVTRDVM